MLSSAAPIRGQWPGAVGFSAVDDADVHALAHARLGVGVVEEASDGALMRTQRDAQDWATMAGVSDTTSDDPCGDGEQHVLLGMDVVDEDLRRSGAAAPTSSASTGLLFRRESDAQLRATRFTTEY